MHRPCADELLTGPHRCYRNDIGLTDGAEHVPAHSDNSLLASVHG